MWSKQWLATADKRFQQYCRLTFCKQAGIFPKYWKILYIFVSRTENWYPYHACNIEKRYQFFVRIANSQTHRVTSQGHRVFANSQGYIFLHFTTFQNQTFANKQKANVIGCQWCRQCLSPANQVAFSSVNRANKFAKWKTGLTTKYTAGELAPAKPPAKVLFYACIHNFFLAADLLTKQNKVSAIYYFAYNTGCRPTTGSLQLAKKLVA